MIITKKRWNKIIGAYNLEIDQLKEDKACFSIELTRLHILKAKLVRAYNKELDEIYEYAALSAIGSADFEGLDNEVVTQELILNLKAGL